jgi:hypothetical protein
MSESPSPLKLLLKEKMKQYLEELAKYKKDERPLHCFSLNIYLAYTNCWKLILRHRLSLQEKEIMCQLQIYKPSRTELGIRNIRRNPHTNFQKQVKV